MNDAQRNLLAKSLADIAKGVFIAAPIALGTGKMTPWVGLAVMRGAIGCYRIAHDSLAGGAQYD